MTNPQQAPRAWLKKKKKMITVASEEYDIGWINYWDLENKVKLPVKFSDCTILNPTGLKDCKGVEIFEGDVVRWVDENRQVVFEDACFWVLSETKQMALYEIDPDELEVIGNRFEENPGLLAQGEDKS